MFDKIIPKVYAAAGDVVGVITVPGGVPSDVLKTGDFISGMIRFLMVLGGLYSLWQFLSGGFQLITAGGDKSKITEANQKFTMSITGLAVMTGSFLLIGIISLILFGNFTYILNPVITPITP